VESTHTKSMRVVKQQDMRETCMITIMRKNEMVATGMVNRETKEPINVPACVTHYNEKMGVLCTLCTLETIGH